MRKLVLVLTFSFGLSTVGLSQHTDRNQKKDAREKPATQVAAWARITTSRCWR
jgi:hypothetical protein